jgi:hypothetical protein
MAAAQAIFSDMRLKAARRFAHTMIVVDDEADQSPQDEKVTRLRTPSRLSAPGQQSLPLLDVAATDKKPGKHALNAKVLIDRAMDLGLVCSIVRPSRGEDVRARVKRVAQAADIVCLDWEIYNDGGESAAKIIKDIVTQDAKQHGRLRLIAVYTGDVTNIKILEKICESFSKTFQRRHNFNRDSLHITSGNGLKVVCLFKTHGIQLSDVRKANQVDEAGLPARLQEEFATLSGGLLSTVALATIAAIRGSTHHVLGKITGDLDGPYFHHRALLENVSDAEEYAVDVVLSELKNAVDKQEVSVTYAGPVALAARIRELADGSATLSLKWKEGQNVRDLPVDVGQVIALVTDGYTSAVHASLPNGKPARAVVKKELATFFSKNPEIAKEEAHRFAILTSVRTHPGSFPYAAGTNVPTLGLGTIVQHPDGTYLLCLQASCDSVRLRAKSAFLFIPMMPTDGNPDHVAPLSKSGKTKSVGLAISKISYATARSIEFEPSASTKTVVGVRSPNKKDIHFKAADGVDYLWIASLKQRRALRTAQRLGQNIGRLGFDEFEPFRIPDDD